MSTRAAFRPGVGALTVQQVAPGEPGHGVVRHADVLRRLLAGVGVAAADPATVVHAHFTDALWGPDVASAAHAFTGWASGLTRPLTVTLHDVPGIDPDPARDRRRIAAYRRVAHAAGAVVVSDRREARDVAAWAGVPGTVVPLPVTPLAPPGVRPSWADRPSLGVLGHLYPGKGHDELVRAAAGTGARVVALGGGPAPAVTALRVQAARLGVPLVVTGALSEADLHAGALAVTVPVAAYRTLGASGSIATWRAAGRRALARPTPHVQALLEDDPRAVRVWHGPLHDALRAALQAPAGTWGPAAGPEHGADVAVRHAAVYAALLERSAWAA